MCQLCGTVSVWTAPAEGSPARSDWLNTAQAPLAQPPSFPQGSHRRHCSPLNQEIPPNKHLPDEKLQDILLTFFILPSFTQLFYSGSFFDRIEQAHWQICIVDRYDFCSTSFFHYIMTAMDAVDFPTVFLSSLTSSFPFIGSPISVLLNLCNVNKESAKHLIEKYGKLYYIRKECRNMSNRVGKGAKENGRQVPPAGVSNVFFVTRKISSSSFFWQYLSWWSLSQR